MLIVIDNTQSLAVPLYRYLEDDIRTFNVDQLSAEKIAAIAPKGVILACSDDAREYAIELIQSLDPSIPVLCLGLSAFAQTYGGQIVEYSTPLVSRCAHHLESDLLQAIETTFEHKTAIKSSIDLRSLSADLRISAISENSTVLALQHNSYPHYALGFDLSQLSNNIVKQIADNFQTLCEQYSKGTAYVDNCDQHANAA